MQQEGVTGGVVNASGDLTAWGYQPDGKPWTIGIVNPNAAGQVFSMLNVTDMALATSGNYEKYITIDGKRYSHTINPRTGLPIAGIKSVTILCPNAEIADAMATPVPSNRFKLPIGFRLNYILGDRVVLRGYYRYYLDNWGLRAHSSNYALSSFSSHFFGLDFRVAPPKGVFGTHLSALEMRYGHYSQTTDLVSDVISLNLMFR